MLGPKTSSRSDGIRSQSGRLGPLTTLCVEKYRGHYSDPWKWSDVYDFVGTRSRGRDELV